MDTTFQDDTASLAPVRDDIALSDRFSNVYFDITRSGNVILYSDFSHGTGNPNVILHLETDGTGWSWQKGWLPVLQIGERYEMFAAADELLVRDGDRFSAYPSARSISRKDFETARDALEAYWLNWFAEGLELPHMTPFLDNAWRSSLVQALCSFAGYRASYGAEFYRRFCHDSFPPSVIAMLETLVQFKHPVDAVKTYQCFFERFITPEGTIRYYGPSLSEYGAFLWVTALLIDAAPQHAPELVRLITPMVIHLLEQFDRSDRSCQHPQLLDGSPEADERQKSGQYFHNNLHVLLGLRNLSHSMNCLGHRELAQEMIRYADFLDATISLHYEAKKTQLAGIPYSMMQPSLVEDIQSERDAMYANYRYYPEMLECGIIPEKDALQIIHYRESHNGEFHGMTLFTRRSKVVEADNWPMASYARGLLEYGQFDRFMRLLDAQAKYYISEDTFTAYEQVNIAGSPRTANAPACVPVQLLLPRLLAWSFSYTKWNGEHITGLWERFHPVAPAKDTAERP